MTRGDWPKEYETGHRVPRNGVMLIDAWREWPHPIPDRVVRDQLKYEIARATRELIEIEERIERENREHGDIAAS